MIHELCDMVKINCGINQEILTQNLNMHRVVVQQKILK